ncbi:MAG TPA: methyltransferase domain-containing protein [Phycisphaerae bacterium]|nr:methyltransferase domain-containing protein [Phycisphaerae bacterium]
MALEFDGNKYRQASAHQKEWGARLIDELELRGAERILDLGCGDGVLTARLADLVPRGSVLGIDASAGMIEAAREHCKANLAFERKDIDDIDFANEFDVVFSNATLHWVKDHRHLLANVVQALRGGGVARFNFAGDGNCGHFVAVVREVMAREVFAKLFRRFAWPWYMPPVADYERLVAECGFAEARVWGENADRHFADAAAMVAWIDQPSIVPFLAHLPEALRQEFRDAVVDGMIAASRQADGRCFETFRRVNLVARKAVSRT